MVMGRQALDAFETFWHDARAKRRAIKALLVVAFVAVASLAWYAQTKEGVSQS